MSHGQLLLHLSCIVGCLAGSVSSGIRHPLGSCLPSFLLFSRICSIQSCVLSYSCLIVLVYE